MSNDVERLTFDKQQYLLSLSTALQMVAADQIIAQCSIQKNHTFFKSLN